MAQATQKPICARQNAEADKLEAEAKAIQDGVAAGTATATGPATADATAKVGTAPAQVKPGTAPQIPGKRSVAKQTATAKAPPADGDANNNIPK